MSQRGRLVVIIILGLIMSLFPAVGPYPAATAHAANGQPLSWGAYPSPRAGESKQQAVQRLEALAGRKLDTVRIFYRWDEAFPTSYETWLKSTDHTVVMSVKSRRLNGTAVRWGDVANAQPGSTLHQEIVNWARRVRDWGVPIYVTYTHEPETGGNTDLGVDSDFINAWRKWVSIFRSEGATNATFLWIMTDYSFSLPSTDRRQAVKWYPGDSYVDGIGVDAYNWFTCRQSAGVVNPWWSMQQIIEPQRQFALQHPGKQIWVTEYASAEDPNAPNRKAQWYAEAQALFKTGNFATYSGVLQYEADTNVWVDCEWPPDSSASAANAWKTWGQDPYYGGPAASTPPTAAFNSSCSVLTCSFNGSASSDADGPIASYRWTFGDNTTGTGAQVGHTYAAAGTYTVTLTVTDSGGATSSVSHPVTVGTTATPIAFRAAARSIGNSTSASLTVPSTVQAGDGLLLFASLNVTSTALTGPSGVTGWTQVANFVTGSQRTVVWRKVAAAGDAGRPLTLGLSAVTKVNLQLSAYGGTSTTNPVAAFSTRSDTVDTTTHTTPPVAVSAAGSWLVSYWADKSSTTTDWTPPAGVVARDEAIGSGGGHIDSLLADSGGAVPTGTAGNLTARTNAASRAATVSIVLRL